MAQYYYQNSNQPYSQDTRTSDVQRSILSAYILMFAGLLLTAAVSYLFYATGWLLTLAAMPMFSLILCIVQIGLAFGFAAAMGRASLNTLRIMFFAYAGTMGISLSSLIYTYSSTVLFAAFLISALYFGCLAFIGYTTKKDMSKIGNICLIGLIVLVISQLVMMLFRTAWSVRLFSIIGLLLFTGLTAWDVQRLNVTMLSYQGQPVAQQKWAVYFALQLYLDFINIFMYILQLLSAGERSRR